MEVKEAIDLAKTGSERAFNFLYNKYKKIVYSSIYGIVKNKDVADDLLSETFLKAFKNLDKFEKNISFELWIKTIANNHSIDFIRKMNKNRADLYIDDELSAEFIHSDFSNPEKDYIKNEEYDRYERGLKALSPRSREVLSMRFQQDLSYQQIADKLGISIGTVKHYIHKYKQILISNITNQSSKKNEDKAILISGNKVLGY